MKTKCEQIIKESNKDLELASWIGEMLENGEIGDLLTEKDLIKLKEKLEKNPRTELKKY